MTRLYIIRNQHGLYLSKQQEWLDGSDRNPLYRTVHRDEAINTVFEMSSRDIHLRAEVLVCDTDARGNPVLGDGVVPAREQRNAPATDGSVSIDTATDTPADAAEVAVGEGEPAADAEPVL
jgi:hypothetical protein